LLKLIKDRTLQISLLSIYHILCFLILLYVIWVIVIRLKLGRFKIELIYQLEYFFLVIPILIVGLLTFMRLPHLYKLIEEGFSNIVIIIGFQWYWVINSYRIFIRNNSLSYLIESRTEVVQSRENWLRFTGSSNDVIHRMYIPSLCFKMDLIPGRTTSTSLEVSDIINYGVCAEICGANHAFIPFKYSIAS